MCDVSDIHSLYTDIHSPHTDVHLIYTDIHSLYTDNYTLATHSSPTTQFLAEYVASIQNCMYDVTGTHYLYLLRSC